QARSAQSTNIRPAPFYRPLIALSWYAWEDHDSDPTTPNRHVLKANDYAYPAAPASINPCP
ncbi:MAG: hypothetical protein MI725_01105, partial [Pirellulales bacterium]|nr:hypothetical protein [Pirellulales bacterium]